MNRPKVSIVIPIHNGIDYTMECLDSLKKIEYPNYEIIIVDDGSTDESKEIISQKYPGVKILKGNGNLWWSGSMNLGIKEALDHGAEYILALNNDNVVSKDFLNVLIQYADEHPKSIVGSKVYFIDQLLKIRYAGGYIDWKMGKIIAPHYGEIDHGQCNEIKEVQWLGGMGVLMPRILFHDVGYFDDKYFPQYLGDIDLWLRAHHFGYTIIFNPKSIVWDHTDKSGTKNLGSKLSPLYIYKSLFSIKSHINIKGQIRFFVRHCPKKYKLRGMILFYLRCLGYWSEGNK
jgi:GT2 family glycosyltransferase